MTERRKMKIGHSLEQLEDDIILTLQDRPVINRGEVNDEEDVLENAQKRQSAQAAYNSELSKKLKRVAHAATSHLQAKMDGKSGILPHYDDYTYKNQEIQIEQGTVIKPNKPKKQKNIPNDFAEEPSQNQVGTEYTITPNKNIKRKDLKNNTKQLLNFLNETAEDNEKINSPKRVPNQIIQETLDQLRQKRNLEEAVKRQVLQKSYQIENIQTDQDFLMRAIQKSRKMQERQSQKRDVAQLLEIIKWEPDQDNLANEGKTVEIQLNPVSFKLNDLRYEKKQYSLQDVANGKGTNSMMFVSLPSERIAVKQKDPLPESFKEITAQELKKMKQEVSFLQDQTIDKGLAGTIAYLREHSILGRQEYVGRNTDRGPQLSANEPNDRIKLEYRNANGKLMKPKEAYRYMCAVFHGEGPGKNKIEKRRKRELLEEKIKEKSNTDGALMQMLDKHQKTTDKPYMEIQLGSKQPKKN